MKGEKRKGRERERGGREGEGTRQWRREGGEILSIVDTIQIHKYKQDY